MDKEKRNNGASEIDDILSELNAAGGGMPKASNTDIDRILAELGMGKGDDILLDVRPAKPAGEGPAPRPSEGKQAKTAQEQAAKAEGMAAAFGAKPPEGRAPTAPDEQAPQEQSGGKTSLFDGPRLGKAAALDKVDPDKYKGETELLSWFSPEENAPRGNRRAEKKARKAAEKQSLFPPEEDSLIKLGQTGQQGPKDALGEEPAGEEPIAQEPAEEAFAEAQEAAGQTLAGIPVEDLGDAAQATQVFQLDDREEKNPKVPTAAYTQEFGATGDATAAKNLFVDDMVDDRFRDFFSETAAVNGEEAPPREEEKPRKKKRFRNTLLTDEFTQMAELTQMEDEAATEAELSPDDYNRPQDAPGIEADIAVLRSSLLIKTLFSGVLAFLLLWMALAFGGVVPIPAFISPELKPVLFAGVYLILTLAALVLNFSTVAAGIVGLGREATADTPVALAAISALMQAAVMLVQMLAMPFTGAATLFGSLAALLLCFNNLGKWVRAKTVQSNFALVSSGQNHSAAYVIDGSSEVVFNLTKGLNEELPVVLVNRPTTVVKGFLRQSFSRRQSDYLGRITGWILLVAALLCAVVCMFQTRQLILAISSFTAILCIGAPLSSTLLSAVPSLLMQRGAAKVGAVIPGWTGIQELGDVNVVMATARDIFPPSALRLENIKTFDKERVDLAIQYAASIINAGCDTLRELFLEVLDNKTEMLFPVDNLVFEPGRGFSAWINNSRVLIGNREILQKHDIATPSVEMELKYTDRGSAPLYLAISGKLTAMFVIGYNADPEVKATLDSFVSSGVSLMVVSEDMNVTGELIEEVYRAPAGVMKVLSNREREMLEPLTEYIPASEGVMSHLGTFSSFIGGMRAAAGCASAERMSGIVQVVSVVLAVVLCLLLAFSGALPSLSLTIILLYQVAWTLLVAVLPASRRY